MSILTTTIGYLAEQLDVFVSTSAPSTRPRSFITITRDGGTVTEYDDRASLTVQVWHEDALALESFVNDVINALTAMPNSVDAVSRVDVQQSWYPEQGAQTFPRYVLSCEVYCHR